jgi:hypothetical protein
MDIFFLEACANFMEIKKVNKVTVQVDETQDIDDNCWQPTTYSNHHLL